MKAGERPNHPVELLSASIDGELKPPEAAALEAHLEGCAECRGLIEDFRKLEGTISDESPPAVPADLRERILADLASQPAAPPVPFWKQAMPLAAAASLLMAVLLWWGRPDRLPPLRPHEPLPAAMASSPETAAAPTASAEAEAFDAGVEGPAAGLQPLPAPPPPPPPGARRTPDSVKASAANRAEAAPRPNESENLPRLAEKVEEVAFESGALTSVPSSPAAGPAAVVPDAPPAAGTQPSTAAEGTIEVSGFARQQARTGSESKSNESATKSEKEVAEALRSLGDVGDPSGAGVEAAPVKKEPTTAMRMASVRPQPPGLFAPPYTVRLVADRRMLVQSGPYACTAAVDDADGQRITAALQESERMRPREPQAAAPRADAAAPPAESAAIVPATPEAREVILRLVRERYRRALESRCGPLPN